MADQNIESLIARYECAKRKAWPWHEEYADCYKYTQPFRNSFTYSQSTPDRTAMYQSGDIQDESTQKEVYDSIGILGSQSLVAKLISNLVPPYQQWQKFDAGPEISDLDRDAFMREAQKLTDLFFKFINESNFYVAATEAFYDLIVGTAALYITKGESTAKPLNFRSVAISQLFFEESETGLIDTVFYRRPEFKARDIMQMWPKAKLGDDLARELDQNENLQVDLIEMTIFIPEMKKYRYLVVDEKSKNIMIDSKSDSSPWIIFRWSKSPAEEWGTGPCMHTLSDIKTLNAIAEDELRSAALKAAPMWFAWSDGVFNPNQFVPQPGAVLVGSGLNSSQLPIRSIPVEGDTQFTQLEVQDIRSRVERAMFVDMVRPNDASPLTATEVLYKQQVLLEQTVPAISRLQIEFLPRMTDRVIYLLKNWGLFPDITIDGRKIRLTYTSPLAQGQKNSDIQAFIQYIQILQQSVGAEAALGALNLPKLPTWLAEKIGVDLDLVKTEGEVQDMMVQAAQVAAQQEQQLPTPAAVPQQQPVQL